MSNHVITSEHLLVSHELLGQRLRRGIEEQNFRSNSALAAQITKRASKQTYYTIQWLVDRDRIVDAYRAYAYFRWVDDWLDQKARASVERLAFVERQQALLECCYEGAWLYDLTAEERMLVELIRTDDTPDSGLQSYIRNMMAVMAFDANRRGRLISQKELDEYSRCLATAVTEALHYFIGHDSPTPQSDARYFAVTCAHITHMLRDTVEDIAAGYFNIPYEFLDVHRINPWDVESDAYREWVQNRVQLARNYFKAGKAYLTQVKNRRCRIAGYAYMARFEGTLNSIEKEGYWLRAEYKERKSLNSGLRIAWSTLTGALKI